MTIEPTTRSRLSKRVQDVPPSGIRKFFDVLATMPDVISLGVGEPDFDTPDTIKAAANVLEAHGWAPHGVVTREGLHKLRAALLEFKRLDKVSLPGLKSDRATVFPAGIAILCGVFEALGLERITRRDGRARTPVRVVALERIVAQSRWHEPQLVLRAREELERIEQAGRRKFILAPGCTVMTHAPEHILQCVRDTVNEESSLVAA